MNILLLGEYSNVHNTLAQGLRQLGHYVVVASNGDFWKDFPRDVDLVRTPGKLGGIRLMLRIWMEKRKWQGFDVVQLINPLFVELKAERNLSIYNYLRQHNRHVILGAFGMDYYWVSVNDNLKPLRYSDFNIGAKLRHDEDAEKERRDWVGTKKQMLNEYIANDCDYIVSGLYEYWVTYQAFKQKMKFIPYPIWLPDSYSNKATCQGKIKIFVGISKSRSAYKGTDIMLKAAEQVQKEHPDTVELEVACGVPFEQYMRMMDSADLILDQLYSYTPAMNALQAMAKGIIVVGGGEPENYEILDEQELRPIINVLPTYDSVYQELTHLAEHPERISTLKQQSREYIKRHHHYIKVARQYEELYKSLG